MPHQPTRRDVLRAGAATGLGLLVGPSAFALSTRKDPIRFAIVGVAGRGGANLQSAAAAGKVVALCDVDAQHIAKAVVQYPDANTYTDFRVMLESMGNEIDAVVVSTPDHTHAVAAAAAMKMGKHVYCEKPLSRTIGEARKLTALARSSRVATQMGNQGTAGIHLKRSAALIKSGAFGAVKEVHCWTDRAGGWWPQGVPRPEIKLRPRHVDFELWLGPSPNRAYSQGYHPFAWRGWWDFGSGALGDIGCHCMNLPFAALDLRDPIAVQATTSGHNRDSFPSWSIVKYEFGARSGRGPVALSWYDGGKVPPQDIAGNLKLAPNGCLIVCDNATLYSAGEYGGEAVLVSGETMPTIEVEESPGHFAEFVDMINGTRRAGSNIADYSGALTETVLLGNLAVWADGPRLEWDSRNMRVKGAPEYDALISPEPRYGWEF